MVHFHPDATDSRDRM